VSTREAARPSNSPPRTDRRFVLSLGVVSLLLVVLVGAYTRGTSAQLEAERRWPELREIARAQRVPGTGLLALVIAESYRAEGPQRRALRRLSREFRAALDEKGGDVRSALASLYSSPEDRLVVDLYDRNLPRWNRLLVTGPKH